MPATGWSSRREVFCKKEVPKKVLKFTRKHLCRSLFFNKVSGLLSATLLKKDSYTDEFQWILRNPWEYPFIEYLQSLHPSLVHILTKLKFLEQTERENASTTLVREKHFHLSFGLLEWNYFCYSVIDCNF